MSEENVNTESKSFDFKKILSSIKSFLKLANEKLPFGRLALKAGEKVAFLKKVSPFANLAVVVLVVLLGVGVAKAASGGGSSNGMIGNTYKSSLGGTITFNKDGTYDSTLMYIKSKTGTYMSQNGENGVQAVATRSDWDENNGFKTEDNGKTIVFYAGGYLPMDTLTKY